MPPKGHEYPLEASQGIFWKLLFMTLSGGFRVVLLGYFTDRNTRKALTRLLCYQKMSDLSIKKSLVRIIFLAITA